MLCQRCKKNTATYHNVEIIDGKRFESHLCEICHTAFPEADSGLYEWMFGTPNKKRKTCPVCGTTFAEYERTGLLGCASCYDIFKEELTPTILRIQGKVEHVGKVGKNMDELGLHRRLKTLQEQLENALRVKNFKEADRLNRQINAIKKMLHGGGNGQID